VTPTFASHGPDSLFQALLTDSLENLYSIALGQTLTTTEQKGGREGGRGGGGGQQQQQLPPKPALPLPLLPPPPPPALVRASSSSYIHSSSGREENEQQQQQQQRRQQQLSSSSTSSSSSSSSSSSNSSEGGPVPSCPTVVRQSLHPFFGPCSYGEEVHVPGATSLRVTIDGRSAFGGGGGRGGGREGGEATLCFWRSEDEPRQGIKPLKRLPSKSWVQQQQQQQKDKDKGGRREGGKAGLTFVVPNTDRLYYSFEARGGDRFSSSNPALHPSLPPRLDLEPTHAACRSEFTAGGKEGKEGGLVRCLGGFPSFAPKGVVLRKGRWYYEVTMVKPGLAQLGWGDVLFSGSSVRGEGVGDDIHSWGVDGHRVYRWHGGGGKWGCPWKEGDVLGFACDLEARTLSFSVNGSWEAPVGVAFEEIEYVEGLRPCLTLNKSCSFLVSFGGEGEEPLKYLPKGHRAVAEAAREEELQRSYWGYRFEVSPSVGLQTRPCAEFRQVWKSSPSSTSSSLPSSSPSSSASMENCTIWRPKVGHGCALLGDVATGGGRVPDATLTVIDDDSPYLALPQGYRRLMTLPAPPAVAAEKQQQQGALWRPLPPPGFVAMGDVFWGGGGGGSVEPPLSLVRCVREDAVEDALLFARIKVWKEGGRTTSSSSSSSSSMTLWGVGNQCHTFLLSPGYNTPSSLPSSSSSSPLKGYALLGSLPGTSLPQAWTSEIEAHRQPSMEWALWVLDCFLETCASWELTAGGILSGRTYEALLTCIVDASHCTDQTRTPAASLLTRLLRTRRALLMSSSYDGQDQEGGLPLMSLSSLFTLPSSVQALGKVTPELLRFCRDRLLSSSSSSSSTTATTPAAGASRLFLPRDLQQIVELVTTINWVSPLHLAVERSVSGFLSSSSSLPASSPTLLPLPALGRLLQARGMEGVASPAGLMARVLTELRRAAKAERGTEGESMQDLVGLVEFFWTGVKEGGTAGSSSSNSSSSSGLTLSSSSAVPVVEDEARKGGRKGAVAPFCQATLRAWLDSTASSEVVESLHPISASLLAQVPGEDAREGEVLLEGAEVVEVVFDGRSVLPKGMVLTLTGGNPNPGAPPVDWEEGKEGGGKGLVSWSSSGQRKAGEFTTRLMFKGSKLRWSLVAVEGKRKKEEQREVAAAAAAATAVAEGEELEGAVAGEGGEEAGAGASGKRKRAPISTRPPRPPVPSLFSSPSSSSSSLTLAAISPSLIIPREEREGRREAGRASAIFAAFTDATAGLAGLGPNASEEAWGFGFTVLAKKIAPSHRLMKLMRHVQDTNSIACFPADWSVEQDVALVEWLNTASEALGRPSIDVSPFDFRHGGGESSVGLQLDNCPMPAIYLRIALLQGFNRRLQHLLPLIDLGNACRHSLGAKLRALAHLVLRDVKMAVVEAGKERTQGSGGNTLTITLDNFAASRSMEAAERDISTSRCIFVQAFRALHHKDPKVLRSCWDGDRVFQVTFRGENGSDAGGVFREGMSRVVEDLYMPDALNLLIPCPNAQHGLPTNVDKFLPNPHLATCPLALDMFEFVGKLMGMSLRANLCLPFHFPSLVWKRLLGQELSRSDMEAVDTLTCRLLGSVRGCEDEEEFEGKFGGSLTFVATGHDGEEVELIPGGATEDVTFATREAYCDLLSERHLHESDAQIAAIARGLYAVVARDTLLLLTWHEFETLVCGSPTFDMDFWKAHTTYSGYSDDDPTIVLFWKVLESLSQEEQSGFVRFAWGRSRLPPKSAWYKNMQISRRNAGEDSLPASHTCFFSIELPPYKSEAAMRKGLLTAITYGAVGILNT